MEGVSLVVIRKDLSCREDLVVADRRMGISPIFGGQPVLIGERGQVRHLAAIGSAIGAVSPMTMKTCPNCGIVPPGEEFTVRFTVTECVRLKLVPVRVME